MTNTKIKYWLMAIRPRTILASIGPVILGLSLAYSEFEIFRPIIALLTLTCAVLLQFATNIANDYLDFKKGIDTHERIGPKRVTSEGLLSENEMRSALMLLLGLAFILGLYLMYVGGFYIILIGLLSLYFSYGYTGGPFPLSYHGLGEASALLFFGIFAVTGTSYLQSGHVSHLSLILGTSVGFISAAILAINNLRDLYTDKKNGKRTLAVRIGENNQRKLIVLFVTLPLIINFFLAIVFTNYFLFFTIIAIAPFASVYRKILKEKISPIFNQYLGKTAVYLFLFSILTSLALITKK